MEAKGKNMPLLQGWGETGETKMWDRMESKNRLPASQECVTTTFPSGE